MKFVVRAVVERRNFQWIVTVLQDIDNHKKGQKTTFQDYLKKLNVQTFLANVLFYLFILFFTAKNWLNVEAEASFKTFLSYNVCAMYDYP